MDLADALCNSLLNEIFRGVNYAANSTVYVSAWNGDPFVSGTEVGTPVASSPPASGYVRPTIAFTNAASSRSLSNSAQTQITMPTGLASNTPVSFLGIHTDQTTTGTGSMLARVPILGTTWEVTVGTDDLFTTGVAHGLAADDRIVFQDLGPATSPTLPTGITAGQVYYVLASGLTSTAFKVSTSSGGSALDVTAAGGCLARKLSVQTFNGSNVLQIDAGALTIRL